MSPADRLRDQRGLVGKAIVGLMLALAVLAVFAVEGGSILFTKLSISSAADAAAGAGAGDYSRTHDRQVACTTVLNVLHERDEDARLTRCDVAQDGTVTVTVKKKASTLIVQRVGFLRKLGIVRQTAAVGPPPV
jgi:Flp pilus assembly protein TadG